MTDQICVSGLVATEPRFISTSEGLSICSFRLASPQRYFNKTENQWVDGETNWYTVTAFRQSAENAAESVHKGDRLVLSGKLRLRQWERDDKSGMSAEIEADALGHDLRWGTTVVTRSMRSESHLVGESGVPDEPQDALNDSQLPTESNGALKSKKTVQREVEPVPF